MRSAYKARWASKPLIDSLRKNGALNESIVVNSFKGFILVSPEDSKLGRGRVLPLDVARFELDPAWCSDPPRVIRRARAMLGI